MVAGGVWIGLCLAAVVSATERGRGHGSAWPCRVAALAVPHTSACCARSSRSGCRSTAIAGTSMGAVVGGLYASGVPLSEIEAAMVALDWNELFDDRTAYRDLVYRRKDDRRRYHIGLRAGIGRDGLRWPSGLRSGQKLGALLRNYLLPVASIGSFDQLTDSLQGGCRGHHDRGAGGARAG